MDYQRVTPRSRNGTSGISEEFDISAGEGCWISPPDRIAAITVAIHVPDGSQARYRVQFCCNRTDTIGMDGTGGHWYDIYEDRHVFTASEVFMLANALTGIRVMVEEASEPLNVCFVG